MTSEQLFWPLCLQLFFLQIFTVIHYLVKLFRSFSKVPCLCALVVENPTGKSGILIISWFTETHASFSLSVWQHVQKKSEKGRFPSPMLVWTMWKQAGRHAMVVDLAHPDCGLLSLSVVHPLSEQSRHREEGEHRGGGGLRSTAVTLLHIIWESGGKEGFVGQRDRERERDLLWCSWDLPENCTAYCFLWVLVILWLCVQKHRVRCMGMTEENELGKCRTMTG